MVVLVVSFAGAGVSGAEDSFGRGVTAVGDLEAIAGENGREVRLLDRNIGWM